MFLVPERVANCRKTNKNIFVFFYNSPMRKLYLVLYPPLSPPYPPKSSRPHPQRLRYIQKSPPPLPHPPPPRRGGFKSRCEAKKTKMFSFYDKKQKKKNQHLDTRRVPKERKSLVVRHRRRALPILPSSARVVCSHACSLDFGGARLR